MNKMIHYNKLFLLFFGAVLISFSSVWVKICGVSAIVSAFYRVFFGGLMLLFMVWKNRELKWHGKHLFATAVGCGLFFALDLVMYHKSIHYVGPGLGTILPNFQVFVLTLYSGVILKEKLPRLFIIALPLALLGLVMIVGIDIDALSPSYRLGIIMGLAAAFCYSGFLLSLRKLQAALQRYSFNYVLMQVSLLTALLIALEILRSGEHFTIPTLSSLFFLLLLALFSQVLGFTLISSALPHISPSISGVVLLAQPALAFVWDVIFFGRPTDLLSWCGVGLTLFAIYVATKR